MFVKTVVVLVIALTVLPASMGATAVAIVLFTPVPVTVPDKRTLPSIQPSYVYDSLGNQIAVFKDFDSNIPVSLADIPDVLKQAVISAEDRRFFRHKGVDLKGIARAVKADYDGKTGQQGASTITMQLVKQLYSGDTPEDLRNDSKSGIEKAFGKLRQAIVANRLDRTNTKNEILYEYLTSIYLGQGAYGVGAAAQTYFRKPVRQLSLSEAATIAGIIPAPSFYEPRDHTSSAEVKRKATLQRMHTEGYITDAQLRQALDQELWVDRGDGVEPPLGKSVTLVYSRPKTDTTYPYFVDYVRRYIIAHYGEERLYRGGLQVETTIDPTLQAQAEAAAAKLLKGTKKDLATAIVSVEPTTGFVRALVGGKDFDAPDGQVNLALGNCPSVKSLTDRLGHKPALAPRCSGADDIDGGGSGRSPGSSIKPVVLAAAFTEGILPTTVYDGSPYKPPGCKGSCRAIGNYEGAAYGSVDLRTATVKSVNTVYARLGIDVGIKTVASMAQKLGINSAWYDPKVHGASYSLGGIDVSPLEMASVYAVFANHGLRQPSTPVVRVTDAEGDVLEDNSSRPGTQVISVAVADNVTDVLRGVVEGGTGTRAALGDRPVAGKTGTSQGYGNAWFVGYTPSLSTAVWMGYKDAPRPMRNIKGVGNVAGGTLPASTWKDYMSVALADQPVLEFDPPGRLVRRQPLDSKELLRRKARGGLDRGAGRAVRKVPAESFVQKSGPPPVAAPTGAELAGTPAVVVPVPVQVPVVVPQAPPAAAEGTPLPVPVAQPG